MIQYNLMSLAENILELETVYFELVYVTYVHTHMTTYCQEYLCFQRLLKRVFFRQKICPAFSNTVFATVNSTADYFLLYDFI